jgi:hypothetical protein
MYYSNRIKINKMPAQGSVFNDTLFENCIIQFFFLSFVFQNVIMLDVSHSLLILNRKKNKVMISKYDLFSIYSGDH